MESSLNVSIISAKRSAVGRGSKGTLKHTRPDELMAQVMQGTLEAVDGLSAGQIEDVILGCAMPEAEQGLNLARNAVLAAGWPTSVPGQTINRFCSSGLQAVALAAQNVQLGFAEAQFAGGVESMSMVPMTGNKVSLHPRLVAEYPEAYIGMGHTAERVAAKFDVGRDVQDAFALNSQQKAAKALQANVFADQIVPITARTFGAQGEGSQVFNMDECPRPETSLEGLGKLRPAFSAKGTVTAGNASPVSDGAAGLVLVSDKLQVELGAKVLGRFRGFVVAGVPPEIMGVGPVPAIQKLLAHCGLAQKDVDLFEINEAFAAQAAYCQRELKIDDDRINVNGGAIALGHPLGCTGAKLSVQMLHELERRGGRYGIVSMCIGGGMGAAGLIERV